MSGSLNTKVDIVLALYKESRTVFRLTDIAILVGEESFQSLNRKLNCYVQSGKLENPPKGIYAKPGYDFEELACSISKDLISLRFYFLS